MQTILEWGANFIVGMQQYQVPWLDSFFGTLTWFGGTGYMLLVPLLIWCIDYRLGLRVLVMIALTLYLNSLLKELILLPRPYLVDPRIISAGEHGYSLPSGHAQLVVVYWGLLAAWVAKRWFWCVALFIMLFTGLSRPYLGVHYPSDIAAGWALGAFTLWVYWRWRPRIEQVLGDLSRAPQWGALAVALMALLAVNGLTGAGAMFYACVGMLLGTAIGVAAANRLPRFDGAGPIWKRTLRFLLGMALTLPLLGGFTRLVNWAPDYSPVLAFGCLVLLGIWLVLLIPQLFNMLGLGGSAADRSNSEAGPTMSSPSRADGW